MTIRATSFKYEHDSETGVATITLNRPDRLNALTFQVYEELGDTFRALDTEPGVRAIIITGAGRGFCTGGDVEDIIGALFARDYEGILIRLDEIRQAASQIPALFAALFPL